MKESISTRPVEVIERRIYSIRGHKVLLDFDLAELYGVETKVFIQAVKRNIDRFPKDFMFQLTRDELENLRSQFCRIAKLDVSKIRPKGRKPWMA